MTEGRAPLDRAERALLRRRALTTVPVAVAIGAVVWAVLGQAAGDMPAALRIGFGGFFGLVLLVIVGISLGAALETEKRTRTGVVTDKRLEAHPGRNRTTSYYLSLDGAERSVELWVWQQVRVGQRVAIHSTARLDSVFRVEVLDDPGAALDAAAAGEAAPDAAAPPVPLQLDQLPSVAPLTPADHALLQAHLRVTGIRRAAGGLLLGGVVWAAVVVGWLFVRAAFADADLDRPVLVRLAPLLVVFVISVVNLRTVALIRDALGGTRRAAGEGVLDVLHSNTRLLSPTAMLTGPGLSGDFAWVQTTRRWLPVPKAVAAGLQRGSVVEVVTAQASGVVLEVGGAPAAAPRIGLLEVALILVLGAVLWCFAATPLVSSGPATA